MTGGEFRRRRLKCKLLISEAAKRLGVSENWLGRMERGEADAGTPSKTLCILAHLVLNPNFDQKVIDKILRAEDNPSP